MKLTLAKKTALGRIGQRQSMCVRNAERKSVKNLDYILRRENERRKHFIPRRSKLHRRGLYSYEDVARRPPRHRWFEHFEIGENDDCYGIFRATANKFGSAIEQYTGLKDKNGKEIYEGDIVANGTLTGVVEYKVNDFCAWTVGTTTNGIVLLSGSWTVIGNIHENTELLGGLDSRSLS